MLETTTHFIPVEQAAIEPLVYGSSPLRIVEVGEVPSAQFVQATLGRLQEIGIFSPSVRLDTRALIHERNDTAFVRMGSLNRRNVNARFIIPDGQGGYKNGKDKDDLAKLGEREKITVISGPCLFSASSVVGMDSQGVAHYINYPPAVDAITQPIVEIKTESHIQPYEADAVLRISGFIGELNNAKATIAALNVPRLEYHLYLLDLYAQGLVGRDVVEKWFSDVDARAQRIEGMIVKRLPRHVQVDRVNPLASIEAIVRNGVADGDRGLFEPSLDQLAKSGRIWGQALKRAKPKSFKDLLKLSYPVAHLLKAEDRESTVVVVENPEEIPILRETVMLLPGIVKGANVVGLFPHPTTVLRGPEQSVIERQYMYFFNGERKDAVREVVAANRSGGVIYEANNN